MAFMSLKERTSTAPNNFSFSSLNRQADEQENFDYSSFSEFEETIPAEFLALLRSAEKTIARQDEKIEQLEKLALTDDLTNLWNRRGFTSAFKRELAMAKRDKKNHGLLLLIDLDDFKQVNDMWGHAVGDLYLQTVSNVLMREVRTTDLVARLGGDEFAILMPAINAKDGRERADRLEKAFHSRVLYWEDQALPLKGSFGAAFYSGQDRTETVFSAADLMLYAHKTGKKHTS